MGERFSHFLRDEWLLLLVCALFAAGTVLVYGVWILLVYFALIPVFLPERNNKG
jgi:hypothetical protein